MTGIIGNGLSALLAAQRALQTTSNNIANANTEGYVRQRIDFQEQPGTPLGRVTIGSGVSVLSVARVYDQFLTDNLRTSTSLEQRYAVQSDFAARLNTVLGNPDTGISAAVQRFFDQVEAVGRDPTSSAQRQQLLLEGQSLATRFQQIDRQINDLGNEVDGRLEQAATGINQLAGQIANLNERIMATNGSASSDLLDQRDVLLKNLAGQIDVTATRQADGSVNVLIGSGQSLVLGAQSAELTTIPDPYDASRLQLAISNGGPPQNITAKVSGGLVGGLLAIRGDVLETARRDLGQLASGLTAAFNSQHRQGLDLDGQLGEDFFATGAPSVAANPANPGSATGTATIVNVSALAGRDYEARFNGTAWTVLDRATGATVTATGSGTPADPLLFEGVSFSATAGAAAGDRFLIQPLANAANDLRVLLTRPAEIAAAAPLVATLGAGNVSQATVGAPVVSDINDPKLLTTATIRFDSPTTYVVYTGGGADQVGPLPYTSGDDISFAGWTVKVTGAPVTGDRFFVAAATAGSGDNSNVLALASVAQKGFFGGGTQSLADLGADIVATVGATANRATSELRVQASLREQAEIDLENVSGVNLDEEAANMLRYQDAYLAASKIISVADNLFQTLLQTIGR
jgi:flagellar hook-associated protein 1